jgi:hypothetical protein
LSNEIEWAEKEGGKEHHVNYIILNKDPMNKEDWEEHHQLLCGWIEKFHHYFSDKVRTI